MDITGLEELTLKELHTVYAADKMSIKEAMPFMRDFRDEHGLTDKQAVKAFGVAQRIFQRA